MTAIDILVLVMVGLAGGFLAGMLGVGGGIVFVPVIRQVLYNHHIGEDTVAYTMANSLAIIFAVGISGTYKQLKLKNTHLPSAIVTGVSAIVTSFTISYLIRYFNWHNEKIFNIIFAIILVFTAIRMIASIKGNLNEDNKAKVPPLIKFVPAGLFAGSVTAISGLGGGVVLVPYFNKILKLPIKFSTGLSLSAIPIIALPLLLFYGFNDPKQLVVQDWQTGFLIWPFLLPVIFGAMLASGFGVRFAHTLKPQTIAIIFITFIILTLVKIMMF